jgi:eukaryotic-like serine/threonine-protein kinase
MSANTQVLSLLLRYEELRDQGRTVTPEELCRDCPDLLDDVREGLDKLVRLRPFLQPRTTRDPDSRAPAQADLGAGLTVAVPGFELVGELGRGGMGVVYLARQTALDRLVALKMLRHGPASEAETQRFRTEAQALARLGHPNIVRVYDVGTFDGRPFFSLEYVEGGSLDRRLGGNPRPVREAAETVEVLARAMHAAHQAGVIHRDLKPANVLVGPDGVPKVTDFGLAKRLDDASGRTQTGDVLGTPSYVAPEQAAGQLALIGPAVDTYALGAILYECLTGRPPFRGASALETLEQVRSQEPAPPAQLNPSVPRDLETVCLKCLRKEPERRYATALALADDLRRWLDGRAVHARPVGWAERAAKWARRNPVLAAAGAVAAVLLAALLTTATAFAVVKSRDAESLRRAADDLGRENSAKQQALEESERRRKEVVRFSGLSARLTALEGQRQCEAGRVPQGLLYLVRALHIDPEDHEGLHEAVRTSLDAWSRQFHPLRDLLDNDPHPDYGGGQLGPFPLRPERAAFSPDGKRRVVTSAGGAVEVWDEDRLLVSLPHPAAPAGRDFDARGCLVPSSAPRAVRSVAVSPDGELLVTAAADDVVRVWRMRDGAPVATLRHDRPVRSAGFVRGGQWIGVVCAGPIGSGVGLPTIPSNGFHEGDTVHLWETATGKRVGVSPPHASVIEFLAFSADGKRAVSSPLAAAGPNPKREFRLWDPTTGELIGPALPGPVLAFAADWGTALVADEKKTRAFLWDCAAGGPKGDPLSPSPGGTFYGAGFSPDGKRVVTADANQLTLWDVTTGQRLKGPVGWPYGGLASQAFDPGVEALVKAQEGKVWWWEMDPVPASRTGIYLPTQATFSPGGKLAFDPGRGRLMVYPGSDQWGVPFVGSPVGFCSGERRFLTRDPRRGTLLWDVARDLLEHPPVALGPGYVEEILLPRRFAADGKTLLTGSGNALQLWDTSTGRPVGKPMTHPRSLPQDCIAGATADQRRVLSLVPSGRPSQFDFRLWDTATGEVLHLLESKRGVALRPDGKALAVAIEGPERTGELWDLSVTPPRIHALTSDRPGEGYAGGYFSPDGRYLVATFGAQSMRLLDGTTGELLGKPLPWTPGQSTRLFYSPGGRAFYLGHAPDPANGGRPSSCLRDALTDEPHGPPLGAQYLAAVEPSPDGRFLATFTADGKLTLWDVPGGRPVGPPFEVRQGRFSFTPDSRFLSVVLKDGAVTVCEAATGKMLFSPIEREAPLGFSADGRFLRTTSEPGGGVVRLRDTKTGLAIGPVQLVGAYADGPGGEGVLTLRNGCLWWTPLPRPLAGSADELDLWVRGITGLELTEDGQFRPLDAAGLRDCRRRLRDRGAPTG